MEMDCPSPAKPSTNEETIVLTSIGWVKLGELNQAQKESKTYELALACNDEESACPYEDPLSTEDTMTLDSEAAAMYDKNSRRSSLGADSVLDQDFSEDGCVDSEGTSFPTLQESFLGQEYADDIYAVMKQIENRYHPTNCMADQPHVTEYMRCTLVHWLIKVNHQLQFGQETIFRAVTIADRFLALTPLAQDCLQLLAVVSLFVAAKMEESIVPGISELVAMCGGTYRSHHFRRMEVLILSTLEFVLYGPTSWYFMEHLTLKACQRFPCDRQVLNVARYVLETCLSSFEVSQYLPSVQAAGALLMSIKAIQCTPVHMNVLQELLQEYYSTDEHQDVELCSCLMSRYMAPFLSCVSPENQPVIPYNSQTLQEQIECE